MISNNDGWYTLVELNDRQQRRLKYACCAKCSAATSVSSSEAHSRRCINSRQLDSGPCRFPTETSTEEAPRYSSVCQAVETALDFTAAEELGERHEIPAASSATVNELVTQAWTTKSRTRMKFLISDAQLTVGLLVREKTSKENPVSLIGSKKSNKSVP